MLIGRREVLLGGVGLGFAVSAGPRIGFSREIGPCMTAGIVPGGGKIDQTAALQAAADAAAATGTPLFLPAGIYSTGKLTLKSGTRIEGVPEKTILRYRDGGALLALKRAENVKLTGLVLDGDAKPLGEHGALLNAIETANLDITDCRVVGSTATGILLRASSAVISGNRIHDCASSAIATIAGSDCQIIGNSCARLGDVAIQAAFSVNGVVIANNFVEEATGGISVSSLSKEKGLAVIQSNQVRNLFFRKDAELRGVGIAVEADSVVTGNVIEGAPAYGIMIGWGPHLRDVNVTSNLIRNAPIGIGVSVDPAAGTVRIARNSIAGTKDGAIRALSGLTSVGPDLALASAETYRGVAVHANVAG